VTLCTDVRATSWGRWGVRLSANKVPADARRELGSCPRGDERRAAEARSMKIIVDIYQDEDGRPAGTVRAEGQPEGRSFSGNLEFLALVERLYRADDHLQGPE
jgi:hypothetical protein